MSIRAGQILFSMNQFIVDRIQTGGPGQLNIPQERVYEVGNFQSLGIVRDIPELSFSLDVLDVGTQVEALLTGATNPDDDAVHPLGDGTIAGAEYDLALNVPVDIISPFKSNIGAYQTFKGVSCPHLVLQQAQYRYGLKQNAGENFTLMGDSIFYSPGIPFLNIKSGDGTTTTFDFETNDGSPVALHALVYTELGQSFYALNVSVDGVRQHRGVDFSDTNAHIVFTTAPAVGAQIRYVFASNQTAAAGPVNVSYLQAANADLTVKPAAIRGRDIRVKIGGLADSYKWHDVQSFQCDWKVNLEADYEFGSSQAVARDFVDPPDVSGSVEIKSITIDALITKLNQITGVASTDVVGPNSSVTLPVVVELLNPDTGGTTHYPRGTVLKTLFIPDARFSIPGYEGRVSQKMTSTLSFVSDTGLLKVIKGAATSAQLGLTADVTAPSAPVLSSPSHTSTTVALSWTVSTDDVGVVAYDIYKDGVLNHTNAAGSTTYTVTGLTTATAYAFTVKARDAAGNASVASNSVSVTTA